VADIIQPNNELAGSSAMQRLIDSHPELRSRGMPTVESRARQIVERRGPVETFHIGKGYEARREARRDRLAGAAIALLSIAAGLAVLLSSRPAL